jgi:hypothetical protein
MDIYWFLCMFQSTVKEQLALSGISLQIARLSPEYLCRQRLEQPSPSPSHWSGRHRWGLTLSCSPFWSHVKFEKGMYCREYLNTAIHLVAWESWTKHSLFDFDLRWWLIFWSACMDLYAVRWASMFIQAPQCRGVHSFPVCFSDSSLRWALPTESNAAFSSRFDSMILNDAQDSSEAHILYIAASS